MEWIFYLFGVLFVLIFCIVYYTREKIFFTEKKSRKEKYIKNISAKRIWKLKSDVYLKEKKKYIWFNVWLLILFVAAAIFLFVFLFVNSQKQSPTVSNSNSNNIFLDFIYISGLLSLLLMLTVIGLFRFNERVLSSFKLFSNFTKIMILILCFLILMVLYALIFGIWIYVLAINEVEIFFTILRWLKQLFFTFIGWGSLIFTIKTTLKEQYSEYDLIKDVTINKISYPGKYINIIEIISKEDMKSSKKYEYFSIDDTKFSNIFEEWYWLGARTEKKRATNRNEIFKITYNDEKDFEKLHIVFELFAKNRGEYFLYEIHFEYNLIKKSNIGYYITFRKITGFRFDMNYKYLAAISI